jgi:hypothetical protein
VALNPGVIEIKNAEILAGMLKHPCHPTLMKIILWVAKNHGVMFTEYYREQEHPNDLHGVIPVRAVDIRSWDYNGGADRAQAIEQEINDKWIYDPERPGMQVAILHDSGRGMHFHIQVHPRTRGRYALS